MCVWVRGRGGGGVLGTKGEARERRRDNERVITEREFMSVHVPVIILIIWPPQLNVMSLNLPLKPAYGISQLLTRRLKLKCAHNQIT